MKKLLLIVMFPVLFAVKGLAVVKHTVPFNAYTKHYGEEEKEPAYVKPVLYEYVRDGIHYWDNIYCDGTEYVKGEDDMSGVQDDTFVFVDAEYHC